VDLQIGLASPEELREVMSWQYDPPYELYSGDGLPPKNPERFYAARDPQGVLVGFYYFEPRGEALYYGLGLRPNLTGRRLGSGFVEAGLEFSRSLHGRRPVILTVASFNERAIRVYERAGFRVTGSHVRQLGPWGDVEFTDMERAG
jgi:[ribosomal protein S18]-alanine N-acetyltransferase